MNKTIISLTIATSLASWYATANTLTEAHNNAAYSTPGKTTNITGTIVTTAQTTPLQIQFTANTLLAASAVQIAAIASVTNPTADTEYSLGVLTATGDDADGYETGNNTGVAIKLAQDGKATVGLVNKAIVSDGTPFVVQINHKAILPKPGVTVLNVPLTAYTK